MNRKSFIIGLLSGFFIAIALVLAVVVYSTMKILPKLEAESDFSTNSLGSPFLLVDDSLELTVYPIEDSLRNIPILLKNDRIVIINFWGTWCAPCIREMGSFIALKEKLTDFQIDFFFLSNEPVSQQVKFIEKKNWELPFYQYKKNEMGKLEPQKWPTTYIVKNNIVYFKHEGQLDWGSNEMVEFIKDLQSCYPLAPH